MQKLITRHQISRQEKEERCILLNSVILFLQDGDIDRQPNKTHHDQLASALFYEFGYFVSVKIARVEARTGAMMRHTTTSIYDSGDND